MKIILDGKPLLFRGSGIGHYTYNLLREFARLDQQHEHQYHLYGENNFLRKLPLPITLEATEYAQVAERLRVNVPFPFKNLCRVIMTRKPQIVLRMLGIDLCWGNNFLGIFGPSFKTVITIHDMVYKHYPGITHPAMYKDLVQDLYDHAHSAHLIIAVSESTKRDVIKFLGVSEERIRVIYNGVRSQFQPIHDQGVLEQIRKKYNLPRQFILFAGMLEPRKNIVGLIRAFKKLTDDQEFRHWLVIAGSKGWQYEEIFKAAEDLGIKERVVLTGYIPDQDLVAIYNLADVFAYPSFYEGFGLPVLEAMACGTPVITSNVSSLPEVGGDAAVYVDPGRIEEIALSIKNVLSDNSLRQSLREKGLARSKNFSWENAARQTLRVFEDCMQ